jgi:hypothetical protein
MISSLMMEAARTSETSVDNYFTRQYIPEDNSEIPLNSAHFMTQHLKASNTFVGISHSFTVEKLFCVKVEGIHRTCIPSRITKKLQKKFTKKWQTSLLPCALYFLCRKLLTSVKYQMKHII